MVLENLTLGSIILVFLSNCVFLQEEFLKDVMQFLILRGHTRLIPQGGIVEFPDAILNAKRLDLFNLYREVYILYYFSYWPVCLQIFVLL